MMNEKTDLSTKRERIPLKDIRETTNISRIEKLYGPFFEITSKDDFQFRNLVKNTEIPNDLGIQETLRNYLPYESEYRILREDIDEIVILKILITISILKHVYIDNNKPNRNWLEKEENRTEIVQLCIDDLRKMFPDPMSEVYQDHTGWLEYWEAEGEFPVP